MLELRDSHGRKMRKLRVSLLDACNFRCFYCMPEDAKFARKNSWLTPTELVQICSTLIEFGMEQIRLTGGEPTLRPEFKEIVTRISALPLKSLGLTTNGHSLTELLPFLKKTRCQNINISLDSLDADNFARITRSTAFTQVKGSIIAARGLDFNVRVNAVIARGVNDHEIFEFVQFAKDHDVEVRFLELMRIGEARKLENGLVPSEELLRKLSERHSLQKMVTESDSTSERFIVDGAKIGFISSETRPFCGGCSRLRLTAEGGLRHCLMSQEVTKLKGLTREETYLTIKTAIEKKPYHRLPETPVPMHQLGG